MNDNKKRKELTEKDRGKIEFGLKCNQSTATIAKLLGFSVKTIRRELARGTLELKDSNLRLYKVYSAYYADERSKESRSGRGRKPTHSKHADLIAHVREKLRQKWSPDAIIGRLRLEGETTVCAKTVYNWLYNGHIDGYKRKRKPSKKVRKVGYKNPTAKRIDERPCAANERQSGHWEMDLVVSGAGKAGALLVLTERASRLELIRLLPDKTQSSVITALNRIEKRHRKRFGELFKTITCDNGSEFLDCDGLEASCTSDNKRTEVYYAHPYSSWERGSNENANKLIRKFIKKGDDISKLPVAYIKRIEKWINNYPRRIFGYKTAIEARNA